MMLGRFLCAAMIWLGAGAAAAQPAGDSRAVADDALAALAARIVQACPTTADISSAAERDACAANLSKITLLSESTLEGSLRWGGVSQGDFNPAHNALTLLNSLVWRKLATEARRYSCAACHNPANPAGMNPLVIFNLPNQALSARHEIVYQLSRNQMPPGRGISDDKAREQILGLARAFETIGDRALKYEETVRN